ncbi:L,D-transpeptidase [Synechococcus sp. CBW1004]|uniref:L,D-transpeptidase n=1 Tax=Synechococcus sp. CBW1004 TaxID=1353136 RepID=UPI001E572C49|nr:L,D-transpeptidase [Synechococcus sp. CBW1004]
MASSLPLPCRRLSRRGAAALLHGAAFALGGLMVHGGAASALEAPVAPPPLTVPAATAAPASPAPDAPAPTTTSLASTRQIVLELGRRTISLLEGDKVLGSWPVAIGDPSTPTPTGTFSVENKVVNPQYASTRSGKVNPRIGAQGPLGDRWIGFKRSGPNQYGIHGTPDAWAWTVTSRAAVSNGCVRMLTPHVRQLFDQVEVGTPVIVKR